MTEEFQRPPIATAPMSVVLLSHNDAAELEETVTGWHELLQAQNRIFEIILVEDGSDDGSATLADNLAERLSSLRVFHHPTSLGQGIALRTGVAQAQHPLLLYTLANKQYQPADLTQLMAEIDKVDLATGYRVWRPVPWPMAWWNFCFRVFSRVLFGYLPEKRECWLGWKGFWRRFAARWFFGVQVRDPESVFRLFRRELFRRIQIQSTNSFVHVEVLAKANFLGAMMVEAPVSFVPGKRTAEAEEPTFFRERRGIFSHPDFGPVQVGGAGVEEIGPVEPAPVVEESGSTAPPVDIPPL